MGIRLGRVHEFNLSKWVRSSGSWTLRLHRRPFLVSKSGTKMHCCSFCCGAEAHSNTWRCQAKRVVAFHIDFLGQVGGTEAGEDKIVYPLYLLHIGITTNILTPKVNAYL